MKLVKYIDTRKIKNTYMKAEECENGEKSHPFHNFHKSNRRILTNSPDANSDANSDIFANMSPPKLRAERKRLVELYEQYGGDDIKANIELIDQLSPRGGVRLLRRGSLDECRPIADLRRWGASQAIIDKYELPPALCAGGDYNFLKPRKTKNA